jgi:hypothetical protein
MNVYSLYIRSDIFSQVKPSKLPQLEELVSTGTKYAPYTFFGKTVPEPPRSQEVWAIHKMTFNNLEVCNLLKKAINIVKDTEEYTSYLLNETFGSKTKPYSVPPGTLRFYSQDLICFYNGKTWRKITL